MPDPNSTDLLNAVIEHMPAGVVFAKIESGQLFRANKLAKELLGRDIDPESGAQEYTPRYGLELEDGSAYPYEMLPIPRVMQTREKIHTDDLFVRRPDNSRIQIEVWAAPISWDSPDTEDSVVAVFQDITLRKHHERAYHREQELQRQILERSLRDEKTHSIATLAGGVAHDFNNILVSVLGNASLLQSEIDPKHPWHQPLTSIVQGAERAAAITQQLLTYARSNRSTLRRVALHKVITDVLPLCKSAAPHNVSIHFATYSDNGFVMADPVQIHQLLLNMIINASEAMPTGGEIQITIREETGPKLSPCENTRCICLMIRDTGPGISADIAERIFEPFFTTQEFGSGLGLASVFGIVQGHNGVIRLVSKPGEGATFAIHFPLAS